MGEHASNLGGLLAYGIAENLSIPSYIVDPVVIDEMKLGKKQKTDWKMGMKSW